MKKIFAITIGILLVAAACNKQAAVQPAQNQQTTIASYTYVNGENMYYLKIPNNFSVRSNLHEYISWNGFSVIELAHDNLISGALDSSILVTIYANRSYTIHDISAWAEVIDNGASQAKKMDQLQIGSNTFTRFDVTYGMDGAHEDDYVMIRKIYSGTNDPTTSFFGFAIDPKLSSSEKSQIFNIIASFATWGVYSPK